MLSSNNIHVLLFSALFFNYRSAVRISGQTLSSSTREEYMSTTAGFDYPCIPVLGFAVVSDPMRFTSRLIDSIDFCVQQLVIVHAREYNFWGHNRIPLYSQIKNVTIIKHRHSVIGVSESWNIILKSFPAAPWYLVSAYDVLFLPDQLKLFSYRFWRRSGLAIPVYDGSGNAGKVTLLSNVNFAHTRWANMPGGKGFNLFALSREVIENCGYFDENIFPAFWEDRDYKVRLLLWSAAKVKTFSNIRPLHGLLNDTDYKTGTKYLDGSWHNLMSASHEFNVDYILSKWGCERKESLRRFDLINCTFTRPFNVSENNLSHWKLDATRIDKLRKVHENELQKRVLNI